MFIVQKAKSRINEVEYVEINLKEVEEFVLSQDSTDIFGQFDNNLEKHKYHFPISPKAVIQLAKIVTKKTKKLKKIQVSLIYSACFSETEQKHIDWISSLSLKPDLSFHIYTNCSRLSVTHGEDNEEKLFIVFDGGFNSNDMKKEPYFLKEHEFNYIYEKVKDEIAIQ